MEKYAVFDIGGTTLKYGIINDQGKIMIYREVPSEAKKGGAHVINQVIRIVNEYKMCDTIKGVCISSAGVVDAEQGVIVYANDNIPNYTGLNIKEIVESNVNIPCEVENDVACAGLAERFTGAAKKSRVTLCLTIGTGIGGSLIIGDKVFHGAGNFAGEVGYMDISGEHFEKVASTKAMIDQVAERKGNKEAIDGIKIFELARMGDAVCMEAINAMCDCLARGIASICYIINPDLIVLGGGITAQGAYLLDIINDKLDIYLIEKIRENTKLLFAENGNKAGMLGAYYNFSMRHAIIQNLRQKEMI